MGQTRKIVLGIHDGHNASVCVLVDGRVEYLVQEERLRYQKNFWGFPAQGVRDAVARLGLLDGGAPVIAFDDTQRRVRADRSLRETMSSFDRLLTAAGLARMAGVYLMGPFLRRLLLRPAQIRRRHLAGLGLPADGARAYNHHLCHAAAAYFAMRSDPQSEHLVLTLDGAGEDDCAAVWIGAGGRLRQVARTPAADSVGTVYALITYLMGFLPFEHEYKLMGMAAYCGGARAEEAAKLFHRHLALRADGLGFERKGLLPINMRARSLLRDLRLRRFDEICAGLQKFTEDLVLRWVQACIAQTGIHKVVCGGGVFMNVKVNKLIMGLPEVSYLGVLPSCGDESQSYGAAALAYSASGNHEEIEPWSAIYFGPDFSDAEAESQVRERGYPYTRPDDIECEIARLVAEGHPVARCRGRMEFGARALGNRSILADPSVADCVRVINQMVKKRDFWMPFAPMVLAERADDYLVNPKGFPSPHMMLSFDTKANFREFIAAVHNADLTARAQILREADNPDMYRCLKHFERLTGRGIMLNTSFNLHGYPVVLGPKEALHVFENSGLEYLALGPLMVTKRR